MSMLDKSDAQSIERLVRAFPSGWSKSHYGARADVLCRIAVLQVAVKMVDKAGLGTMWTNVNQIDKEHNNIENDEHSWLSSSPDIYCI